MENEILKVIHNRRSIRNYTQDPVSDEAIEAILEAGIYAPSAMNQQEWHFTVVKDPQLMKKLRDIMKENMLNSGVPAMVERASAESFVAFHNAPVLIFLSADEKVRSALIDGGIAIENMALAAESLGLGSCIMTSSVILFNADQDGALVRELGFPTGYKHVCTLSLGYKAEFPEPKPRRDNLVNII